MPTSSSPRRLGNGIVAISLVVAVAAAGGLVFLREKSPSNPSRPGLERSPVVPRAEAMPASSIDPARWALTSEGDFQEHSVDLKDGRFRFRAATIGTRDDTVKFHGVRSAQPYRLVKGGRFTVDVDWNQQSNGCYLAAQIILAPGKTDGNPLSGADWLKVEYIGVPPGKNGRLAVGTRIAGHDGPLFTEGWPKIQREGRPIGLQHVEIELKKRGFVIRENGVEKYVSKPDEAPPMAEAYLYVQMSTHSNYPAREIYFSNVEVVPAD